MKQQFFRSSFYCPFRVFLLPLLLFLVSVSAFADPIEFRVENVEASSVNPWFWMFDTDDPGFITHDTIAYTWSPMGAYPYHNYAYTHFYSTGPAKPPANPAMVYNSYCTSENLDFVDGIAGFKVVFEDFVLTGFQKANMVVPGAEWALVGQAGDIRIYTGGMGKIYHNDVLVLSVQNCVLKVFVNYPSAMQMRALHPLFAGWITDIGSGAATIVEGWGFVDEVHSDPAWVNVFADAHAQNRIDFFMDTVQHVIQGQYGYYSFNLGIAPAANPIQMMNAEIDLPGQFAFPDFDLDFDFESFIPGGANNQRNLNVFMFPYIFDPLNAPPIILETISKLWQFNTTLSSFETDITFDLSGYGFGDSSGWRILRRESIGGEWQIWGDFTVLDANRIRANNVTAFSDWTIGTTLDNTLPIVLSSFDATVLANGYVTLNWTTESESNLSGYTIFRNTDQNFETATQISPLIDGTNTSNTQTYSFTDNNTGEAQIYYYWLCQIEMSGEQNIHGPILAQIFTAPPNGENPVPDPITAIGTVFPNPFRVATIEYSVKDEAVTELKILNLRGQLVKHLYYGTKAKGKHRITWDGTNASGDLCAGGVYFVELRHGNDKAIRKKMILAK